MRETCGLLIAGQGVADGDRRATGELRDQTSSTVARPAFVSARALGASAGVVTPFVRKQKPGGRRQVPRR